MTTRELMEQKKSRSITDLDDGFSGYTCETEGDTVDERPNSLLQGKRIKFDGRSNKWTVDGVPMPKAFQLLAVKTLRAVLKWGKDKSLPPTYELLAPNQKFPDIDAKNKDAPKAEWITGPDGKPCGPYQNQSVLYLMGMTAAMERYTYASTANNGHVAVDQLAGTINWRRQTTRKPVYPVVGFSDVLWSKKWGLQRAYFVPVRWVEPDLGIENASPDRPQLNTFAETVKTIEETVASATSITEEMDKQLGLKSVEPTLKQDLDDEIAF